MKTTGRNSRQFGHHSVRLLQHVGLIAGAIDQVGEMVLQGFCIRRLLHVLEDLDDDARVPVFVEVEFLMVWDFADLAARAG